MEGHLLLTDEQFESAFATCTLDPAQFTHEAHIRLAYIHIKKYGIDQAVENIVGQLRSFVAHVGASDKFNMTVTVAAIRAVYHFMLKHPSTDFSTFIENSIRLKTNLKDLLGQHYSVNIFEHADAKSSYLEPDLVPFD